MKKVHLFCSIALALTALSCNGNRSGVTRTDTVKSGFASIASEDGFAPIMAEEVTVFEALNAEASIHVINTNEDELIKLLMTDSIRMVIAARDLTDKEREFIKNNNRELVPRSTKIAYDAIALIINKQNPDSLMSMATVRKIMTGEITSWKDINPTSKYDKISVFFDNPTSSTVRFIKDSICRELPLYDGLRAQKSNEDVLAMVAKTPNSLGVIGVNWIYNPSLTDSTNLGFDPTIKVVQISKHDVPTYSNSFKPYAGCVALGDYPLRREIYAILTDLRGTLPAGFYTFLTGDRGQRIILKAGLLPANRPTRVLSVKEKF